MRKVVLVLAVLLVVIAAGLWRYAPELVAYAIRTEAARMGIDINRVEVLGVSWNRLQIAHLDLSTRSEFGDIAIQLADLEADFDPWSRSLLGIAADHANVSGSVRSPQRDDDRTAFALPPIPPVDVGRLDVHIQTPAGPVRFQGSVSGRSSAQTVEVRLTDDHGSIHLRHVADTSALHASASLAGSDAEFLQTEFTLDDNAPTRFALEVELASALSWAQATSLIPPEYGKEIAAWWLEQGVLRASGELRGDRDWMVDTYLAWQNLQRQQYRASGELSGSLIADEAGWQWRAKTPGHLRVILTDAKQIRPSELIAVELSLQPGYTVSASQPADAGIDLAGSGEGRLSAIRQDGVVLSGGAPEWRLDDEAARGRLALTGLRLQTTGVVAARLDTTLRRLDASFRNWSGEFTIADLRLSNWSQMQPGIGVQGQWQSTATQISAAGSLDAPRPGMTRWKLDVSHPVGSLRVNLDAPAPLLLDWSRPLTGTKKGLLMLDSGSIEANIDVDWRDESFRAAAKIKGAQIGGKLVEAAFSGMSIEAEAVELAPPLVEFRARVQEGQLPVDVTWNDLRLAGRWSPTTTAIREASLRALGGELSLAPLSLSTDDASAHRLVVNLAGIDLSQLLQLLGLETLTGHGRLDGSLPIVLSPNGPAIDHGVLIGVGPGTIQYRPHNGVNPAGVDNLALRALQDFRYEILNATLSYGTGGNYQIRLRLVGNNPQVVGGHPIALNPNITGTLPDLLQAVLLTGDFSTAVLRQIQREHGTTVVP